MQKNQARIFVLRKTRVIPNFIQYPELNQEYDTRDQLWRWRDSGNPIVLEERVRLDASTYGETEKTATKEGTDQPECSPSFASTYGETAITETREGIDQSELATTFMSTYGETTRSFTTEGVDQTESSILMASTFGETSITKTSEGVDVSEASTKWPECY